MQAIIRKRGGIIIATRDQWETLFTVHPNMRVPFNSGSFNDTVLPFANRKTLTYYHDKLKATNSLLEQGEK